MVKVKFGPYCHESVSKNTYEMTLFFGNNAIIFQRFLNMAVQLVTIVTHFQKLMCFFGISP